MATTTLRTSIGCAVSHDGHGSVARFEIEVPEEGDRSVVESYGSLRAELEIPALQLINSIYQPHVTAEGWKRLSWQDLQCGKYFVQVTTWRREESNLLKVHQTWHLIPRKIRFLRSLGFKCPWKPNR